MSTMRDQLDALRPRCQHGVLTGDYCAACIGGGGGEKLADRLETKTREIRSRPFRAPTVRGHRARVERAKGRWRVTCSCGATVCKPTEHRERAEQAWARHVEAA